MYSSEELTLNKVIIHLLEPTLNMPILSAHEMETDEDIHSLITHHILKTLNDDAIKTCVFDEEHNLFAAYIKAYQGADTAFVPMSIQLAELLFTLMLSAREILPCDLCITEFHYKGSPFIGILKMNYQSAYIHYTDFEGDEQRNTIVQHRNILPGMGQRVGEAIMISLNDLSVQVLEKPIEIEGVKENYLSKRYLKCHTKLSSKEQFSIVKKVADQITKKFYDEDIEKKMAITKEFHNQLEDSGEINLDVFAKEAFNHNDEVKEVFLGEIEKRGIVEPSIQLAEQTISRSIEKQKIRTDNGIEIKVPIALYNNPQCIELQMDSNGRMSILIKDIQII